MQLPIVSTYDRVLPVVEQWLRSLWLERDRLSFAIPQSRLDVEVGDVLQTRVDDRDNLVVVTRIEDCLLYTSPSPRDLSTSRMPSSA